MPFSDAEGRQIIRSAVMRLKHNGLWWRSVEIDEDPTPPVEFLVVEVGATRAHSESVTVLVPAGCGIDHDAVRRVLGSKVWFPRPGGTTTAPLNMIRLLIDTALSTSDTIRLPDIGDTTIEMRTAELIDDYLFSALVAPVSSSSPSGKMD